jgi:uncharacterized membrane protein
MPLTHQPFNEIAGGLRELERELSKNVPENERVITALAATGVMGFALTRPGLAKWGLLALGGALIYRAMSGHCPVYERLDIDRRHGVTGVAGNRGTRVEEAIEIDCPAQVLYDFWKNLEELPRVMRHVESVEDLGEGRSHWKVEGPMGVALEWDAEIINDHPGTMIAW